MDLLGMVKNFLKTPKTFISNWFFMWSYLVLAPCFVILGVICGFNYFASDLIKCSIPLDSAKAADFFCISGLTYIKLQSGDKHYQTWYRFYPWLLIVQGLLYLIPITYWKRMEGGRMEKIASGFADPMQSIEKRTEARCQLLRVLRENANVSNNIYYRKYIFAELMNFLVSYGQFEITGSYLGTVMYGASAAGLFSDPLVSGTNTISDVIFPKSATCDVSLMNISGKQSMTGDCSLILNDFYRKVYIPIWFLIVFNLTMAALGLFYRICMMTFPCLRILYLRLKVPLVPTETFRNLNILLSQGDIFFVILLSNNIGQRDLCYVLSKLNNRLKVALESV